MEEPFMLTVHYKGTGRDYEAQLHLKGYSYQIIVAVDGTDVYYERDEEGAFRAVFLTEALEKNTRKPDVELLKAIALKIEELLA